MPPSGNGRRSSEGRWNGRRNALSQNSIRALPTPVPPLQHPRKCTRGRRHGINLACETCTARPVSFSLARLSRSEPAGSLRGVAAKSPLLGGTPFRHRLKRAYPVFRSASLDARAYPDDSGAYHAASDSSTVRTRRAPQLGHVVVSRCARPAGSELGRETSARQSGHRALGCSIGPASRHAPMTGGSRRDAARSFSRRTSASMRPLGLLWYLASATANSCKRPPRDLLCAAWSRSMADASRSRRAAKRSAAAALLESPAGPGSSRPAISSRISARVSRSVAARSRSSARRSRSSSIHGRL
jgi:hypothetical protein